MTAQSISSQATSQNLTENLIRFAVNISGRDKDWNYEKLATDFRDVSGTLYDLMEHISSGHALCAGNLNGNRRCKANIVGSHYILVDIDNSEILLDENGKEVKDENGKARKIYKPELTLPQALEHPFVKQFCSLIYTTASHTDEWHRFRLIFLLPEYVDDVVVLEEAIKLLQNQFPHDPSCKDASRVFYGSTQAQFPLVNPDVTLPSDWIEKAREQAQSKKLETEQRLKQWEESRKSIREYSTSQGWDLDSLIEEAIGLIPSRMPGSNNYDESTQVLMALASHYGAAQAVIIGEKWSPSIKGTTWDISKKINSYKRSGITIGTLFHIAKQYGFTFPKTSGKNFRASQFKNGSPKTKPLPIPAGELTLVRLPQPATDIPQPQEPQFTPDRVFESFKKESATVEELKQIKVTIYDYENGQKIHWFDVPCESSEKGRIKSFAQSHVSDEGKTIWKKGDKPWSGYRLSEIIENALATDGIPTLLLQEDEGCVEIARGAAIASFTFQGSNWGKEAITPELQRIKETLGGGGVVAFLHNQNEAGLKKASIVESCCNAVGLAFLSIDPRNIYPELPLKGDIKEILDNMQVPEFILKLEAEIHASAEKKKNAYVGTDKNKDDNTGFEDDKDAALLAEDDKECLIYQARKRAVTNTYGESLRLNELSLNIEIDGEPIDSEILVDTIAEDCGLKFPEKEAKLIIQTLAKKNSYHPVRDYLGTVAGKYPDSKIIENLSTFLFGTTEPLHDSMLKKFLVACVKRVMEPGCKFDELLILCGLQGALKSTALEVLAGAEYFSDSCEGTGNDKDSLLQLHGAWINELAEFDRFLGKRDASDLKKSLSIRCDKFRLPYGKRVEEFPRKFVMCGTTNKDEFLVDPTGNRRYWVIPIQVAKIDIAWLREHRDEIWSAAFELYLQNYECFLNEEEKIRHAQLMRTFEVTDTWEDYIQVFLLQHSEVIISDIMLNCLGIEIGLQKKADQMRVADILKRLGWVRVEKRGNGSKKVWVKNTFVNSEVGTGGDGVGTEVGTAETTTNSDSEVSVPTLVKNSDKTFSTNVTDSEKKSDLPNKDEKKVSQIGVEVGTPPRTIPETPINRTLHTVPTSEANAEAKLEELQTTLDNLKDADTDADTIDMLMCGWTLMERKQVELLLSDAHQKQLRELLG